MDYQDLDFAAIERKAHQLRAEAAAELWTSLKTAVRSFVADKVFPSNLGARNPV